jgi:hypothetical protein
MSSRTNAAVVMESLEQGTSSGSAVVQSFASLTSFAQTAGSAAVLTTLPGVGHLLAAASVSVSAADQIIKAVSQWRSRRNPIPVYDQFRILFYTACHRAYLESLDQALKSFKQQSKEETKRPAPDYDDLARRAKEISDTEVTYVLCVDPHETELPLFEAYDRWLTAVLPSYGVSGGQAYTLIQEVSRKARVRLKVFLTQQTPNAAWLRDYLALSHQERTNEVLTTLAEVATSLREWTAQDTDNIKKRYQDAWADYRNTLVTLPDQPETMFAEAFGVRKVFIAPQGTYKVIGATTKSYLVNNVPRLLGALVSERLPAGDLRILCGGPGSGKSTVCRMLASELAKDETLHPIFLRLRRMREGADIAAYVEESLRKEGLIDRLSDLRDLPNLILILDGFDELVMASRTRLRHFFNVLREELTTGPLRSARAIVSGRDTLFPNGDGLPIGAHVLTLEPFDAPRVAAWGEKWRALHKGAPGGDFKPESLIPDGQGISGTPLQHLASWPLTLHLLARVHTKGILILGQAKGQDVEKAFLYRSIMADTAERQATQAEGRGRFDRSQMQRFLRFLAWEMYGRGTDSLDFDEVVPLVHQFYPDATETEVAEVTDVAIVNAPELTKGEQTGCEFVHKSFSEYLVGEHIAETVELVAFKAAQFGVAEPTWRMSSADATAALASIFASRLITPEVQEMLEPMLGCVQSFFGNDSVEEVRASAARGDGLSRIIERLEMMLGLLARGQHLELIAKFGAEGGPGGTALEAFANYCAGVMIVGTATARRASRGLPKSAKQVYFNGEPVPGGFWRCIGLLEAGGLVVDERLGVRLFRQMRLALDSDDGAGAPRAATQSARENYFDELSFPLSLREFRRIHGYRPTITSSADALVIDIVESLLILVLLQSTGVRIPAAARRDFEYNYLRYLQGDLDDILYSLQNAGLTSLNQDLRYLLRDLDRVFNFRFHGERDMPRLTEDYDHVVGRIISELDSIRVETDRSHLFSQFLRDLYFEWRRRAERELEKSAAKERLAETRDVIQPPRSPDAPTPDSSEQLF